MPHPLRSQYQQLRFICTLASGACLAGCGKNYDANYFPLKAGHWSVFSVSSLILAEPVHGRFAVRNTGRSDLHGESVFGRNVQASVVEYFRDTGDGERMVRTNRGNSRAVVNVDITEWCAPDIRLVKRNRVERSDSKFVSAGQQQWQLLDFGS